MTIERRARPLTTGRKTLLDRLQVCRDKASDHATFHLLTAA